MYIKEIRLNGFKSFADKTVLSLGKNFTGIVGPNGSGKSNILDALKWVLGEGSIKNLRGADSMSDVIFIGSKNREPKNSASVAIVFDNTDKALPIDYNEVEIKRIVYKTGENEYYLNQEKCRLKDITNLLTDSFSSKESFNLIPQGKIDEILLGKSEDRRVIIEEAASVLKYKKRKEESLRKLSNAHENVERVEMIITELCERIEPLQKEATKAIEYKNNKEKLESLDIALLSKDITSLSVTLEAKQKEKNSLEEKLSSSMTSNTKENTLVEKMKLDLIKLEEKIGISQQELSEINNNLSSLKIQKELVKERSKYDKDDDKVKNNLMLSKEKELELKTSINKIKLDIDLIEDEIKNNNDLLEKLNEDFKKEDLKRESINNELSKNKRIEMEKRNRIEILDRSIKDMEKVPYSVKNILGNPILRGIIDIIGNIVKTENVYNTMLSVALQSSFNFVIIEDEICAKEAIEYLKNKNLGRVTFFPLNIIKPRMIDPETLKTVKSIDGFVSVASDLVNYDKKFYNIVMNQLGNIIVSKDSNSMIKISKAINYKYRVISLNGELMNIGGSITGGSLKLNNVLNDKYEIIKEENLLNSIISKIKENEDEISKINQEQELIRKNIYDRNISFVKLRESLREKENVLNDETEKYNLIKDEINSLSNSTKLDEKLSIIMEEYSKEEDKKLKVEHKLESYLNEKKNLNDEIIMKESIIKKNSSSYNEITKKQNELEIEITKCSLKLDNLLTYLNEEYCMTYEKAKETYELDILENDAREIVADLKKKLKVIGDVNLSSIEEYERVNKRFTFLNNQKEDLEKSENDLLEIIKEMDEVMKEEFIKTFEKVNIEFNKVFSQLFCGGEAYLKLTNPDDILQTGVDIVAVPSGKKIKNISQLSGGEKTLTAISLLFAVTNLKNVPFLVLDEVESALDEANVSRFGDYLNLYKGKTQLLIITHKKKTMEYVDVLYGITMQESGISKLVSVKLEELK